MAENVKEDGIRTSQIVLDFKLPKEYRKRFRAEAVAMNPWGILRTDVIQNGVRKKAFTCSLNDTLTQVAF